MKLVAVAVMTTFSLFSGLLQNSQPEQIEAGTAVHLPFDQLESVDLSFNWAIAPRQMQGGFDGLPIAYDSGDEAAECGVLGIFKPPGPSDKISIAKDTKELFPRCASRAISGKAR